MPDETKTEQGEPVNPETQAEPVKQEVDLVKQAEEKYKKEIAGLNRRNSEMEKRLEEIEMAKLSETEKAAKEVEKARKEKEALLQETAQIKRARVIDKMLIDAGLPLDFANRVNGDDEESITADVSGLKTYLENEVSKRVDLEINKKLAGGSPKASTGGQISGTITRATFDGMGQPERIEFFRTGGKIED